MDIQPLGSQMNKIKGLNPVTYDWKTGGKDIGFVAEDLNNTYPEFVKYSNKGEAQGISYDKMVSVLVKTIQEQEIQIQSAKESIKNLKK